MASIHKEILINARPEDVWAAVRDVGAVHQRLVPGVLVDARLDGDARVFTFASGAVVEGPLQTKRHNASIQVFAEGSGRSRLVWITDVLPDDLATRISNLVEQGSAAMKQTLEKETTRG